MVPPDGGSQSCFSAAARRWLRWRRNSRHTRNAVHVITTFDSGGSSAELRRAFDMPAVGDIRARIMALADRSLEGNPEIVELLGYRLPKDAGPEALHRELASLASGAHPLVAAIPEPMNEVVTQHLSAFRSLMPVDMDLAGASIGNLILTSGYLSLDRQLEPVVRVFSGMVQARGVVMPVADSCAHLCVRLENGEVIVGSTASPARPRPPSPPHLICGFQPLWMILLPFPCPSSRVLPTSSGLRILSAILWAVSFLP
ncbi:MAG: 2-phospho-L-lactate transferase CofD family protein [Bilophila wadsworthia]